VNATTVSSRRQLALAFVRDIRSPQWGIAGQLIRFALSGSVVAAVYISVTTVLHDTFGLPFQVALAVGFLVGLALHFTLQRLFVWRHNEEFALAAHSQMVRYLGLCITQYGFTALATSQLPALVGLPVEVIYLMTMFAIAGFNFLFFRGRVFHPDAAPKREAMS
jgi:putative flippase GtrA